LAGLPEQSRRARGLRWIGQKLARLETLAESPEQPMTRAIPGMALAMLIAALPVAAHADCKTDLQQVKIAIARLPDPDKRLDWRRQVAHEEARRPQNDIACHNYASGALRQIRDEISPPSKPPHPGPIEQLHTQVDPVGSIDPIQ
jgi:hypothetical protein